jgi:hypothetical protein
MKSDIDFCRWGSLPDEASDSDEVTEADVTSPAQNRSTTPRFVHRFFFARPANGLSFSRSAMRIGVPGRSNVSRRLLIK